jgi:DNA-directed RNA polymerase specialized sigma24 family protein
MLRPGARFWGDDCMSDEAVQDLSRSIELLLKLKIAELRGDRSQSEMILFLDSLGFKSGEIIKLMGASAATVRPILSRGKKNKKKK